MVGSLQWNKSYRGEVKVEGEKTPSMHHLQAHMCHPLSCLISTHPCLVNKGIWRNLLFSPNFCHHILLFCLIHQACQVWTFLSSISCYKTLNIQSILTSMPRNSQTFHSPPNFSGSQTIQHIVQVLLSQIKHQRWKSVPIFLSLCNHFTERIQFYFGWCTFNNPLEFRLAHRIWDFLWGKNCSAWPLWLYGCSVTTRK